MKYFCKPSLTNFKNFPKFGAKAVAAIRGSFNGSNISGTVSFYQAVINHLNHYAYILI